MNIFDAIFNMFRRRGRAATTCVGLKVGSCRQLLAIVVGHLSTTSVVRCRMGGGMERKKTMRATRGEKENTYICTWDKQKSVNKIDAISYGRSSKTSNGCSRKQARPNQTSFKLCCHRRRTCFMFVFDKDDITNTCFVGSHSILTDDRLWCFRLSFHGLVSGFLKKQG